MKKCVVVGIILLFVGTSAIPSLSKNNQQKASDSDQKEIMDSQQIINQLTASSIFFTKNQGQLPNMVLFQTHIPGATVNFYKDKIVWVFIQNNDTGNHKDYDGHSNLVPNEEQPTAQHQKMSSVTVEFENANSQAVVIGEDALPHYNNYFIGNNPEKWYTKVPNYQKIIYQEIYPGINLTYYSTGHELKYDFILHPGAEVAQIQVHYVGIDGLAIDPMGNLKIQAEFGVINESTPFAYQIVHNNTIQILAGYCQRGPAAFGFTTDTYDPETPLIIDPGLNYSTYLGGSQTDVAFGITVDEYGYTYITGFTGSLDFPTTPGAYDTTPNLGGNDVFITKLSPLGGALIYSTYLGGSGEDYYTMGEGLMDIVLNADGSVSIIGETASADFPTTPSAYDTTYNGDYDVFIAKLSSSGDSLLYSTYFGGSDYEDGVCLVKDTSGNLYITGTTDSNDFPTTPDAYDSTFNGGFDDCFVAKFSSSYSTLIYSTFLGGTSRDIGMRLAVDSDGNVTVVGWTYSSDFPTTPDAYDTTYGGGCDGFVTKFSSSGDALTYSTYLGGAGGDLIYDIKLDTNGASYVTGMTFSDDFPTTPGAYDTTHNGGDYDIFVSKLSPSGDTILYSTYLGGIDLEWTCPKITIESDGAMVITGSTRSDDFPTTPDAYDTTHNGDFDMFVTKLSPTGDTLLYSTYIGGIWQDYAYDSVENEDGYIYITGYTESSNFPTTPGAYDTTYNGGDIVILKLLAETSDNLQPIPDFFWTPENPKLYETVHFDASVSYDPDGWIELYEWDWNHDGVYEESSTEPFSTHSWSDPGKYLVILRITDNDGATDMKAQQVTVTENQKPIADFYYTPEKPIVGQGVTFDASASYDPDGYIISYKWDFGDQTSGTGKVTSHVYSTAGYHTVTLTVRDNDNAEVTSSKSIEIYSIDLHIEIQGGFGVKMTIMNTGTINATDIPWQIHIFGGIFGIIDKMAKGTILICSGRSITVTTGILFGFGAFTIYAKVADQEIIANGLQIIIYSMVKK
jgi:PKD repeat protein